MKLKVAIDIDDVTLNLLDSWVALYKKMVNLDESTNIVIDNWDVSLSMPLLKKHEVFSLLDFPGLFFNSLPIPGAIQGIKELINSYKFDIYFLTVASSKTAYYEKLKWIESYFGKEYSNKVIAVATGAMKNEVGKLFDAIIDDNPLNMEELAELNKICILYSRKHNLTYNNPKIYRFFTWEAIIYFLHFIANTKHVALDGTPAWKFR